MKKLFILSVFVIANITFVKSSTPDEMHPCKVLSLEEVKKLYEVAEVVLANEKKKREKAERELADLIANNDRSETNKGDNTKEEQ